METREHTALGNALRYTFDQNNPYLRIDENGILRIRLQRFDENRVPLTMDLEMAAGEIVAMAGDYFTEADWSMTLNLPSANSFKKLSKSSSAESLGKYLVDQVITEEEEQALITAYNNLAAPNVSRATIDKIYKIDGSTYIPFFRTLNEYVKQLMFSLRVKDYGEMLNRNQTHFTPWSVRVYTLGHHIALKYARLSYELQQSRDNADLAHRYHAMALSMELFTFHYYSDHFASGHMSMVGDLRVLLPQRFGTWGGVLANNIHNELNDVGVYTKKIYDPSLDENEAPVPARGDGVFDSNSNTFNKAACLAGMQFSLQDITDVLMGKEIPDQNQYGGLEDLPDVDCNYRQYQPLLVLSKDNTVYYRTKLDKIQMLSPSDYDAMRANPQEHGYTRLVSKWDAFWLAVKLRILPFIYKGKVQPVTADNLQRIEEDEKSRNPQRRPIPVQIPGFSPAIPLRDWRKPAATSTIMASLNQHSLLAASKSEEELSEPRRLRSGF